MVPSALRFIASGLLGELSKDERLSATEGFTVLVQGEQLSVPYRVYYEPTNLQSVISCSGSDVRLLALCLGTRHWNGYVREHCLRQIVSIDRPWAVPFVVQLLGDYVIEIVEVATATLSLAAPELLFAFALENPQFMATTERRAVSYWNCYHRGHFRALQSYPALQVIDAIRYPARGSIFLTPE